jgi:hypothetical protein
LQTNFKNINVEPEYTEAASNGLDESHALHESTHQLNNQYFVEPPSHFNNPLDNPAMQVDVRNLISQASPPIVDHRSILDLSSTSMNDDAMQVDNSQELDPATLNATTTLVHLPTASAEEANFGMTDDSMHSAAHVEEPAPSFDFESTGKYACRLILTGHSLSISSLKFSPDGAWLASSGMFLLHIYVHLHYDDTNACTEASC